MKNNKKNGGISILFVLILGFIVILVLSYYQISIKAVVESPTGQENLNYVSGTSKSIWVEYLKEPAEYLWNDIWVDILWAGFVSNMERVRDGLPTDFEDASPTVNY